MCRDVIQCTGLCTRPRIPAQLIEGHVLRHLDAFVGKDLEAWIAERLATRTDEQAVLERTLEARRSELVALERRREQRMAELENVGITPLGLELVERIDAQREGLAATVADIEARVGEWSEGPSSDAILDYYCSIRDAVTGRIANATGPNDVAAVLADVFCGIWAELTEPDFVPLTAGERSLKATFVLRRPIELLGWLPAGEPIRFDDPIAVIPGIERDVLPPKPDARGSSTVRAHPSQPLVTPTVRPSLPMPPLRVPVDEASLWGAALPGWHRPRPHLADRGRAIGTVSRLPRPRGSSRSGRRPGRRRRRTGRRPVRR